MISYAEVVIIKQIIALVPLSDSLLNLMCQIQDNQPAKIFNGLVKMLGNSLSGFV